jgi:hypothetical protein
MNMLIFECSFSNKGHICHNIDTTSNILGRLWRSATLSRSRPLVCWWNCKLGNQMCTSSSTWCVRLCSKIRSLDQASNGSPFKWWQRPAILKHECGCSKQYVESFAVYGCFYHFLLLYDAVKKMPLYLATNRVDEWRPFESISKHRSRLTKGALHQCLFRLLILTFYVSYIVLIRPDHI